ncbi:MAG: hypothetical protein V9G24_05945 [Rhodoblastus sp.]
MQAPQAEDRPQAEDQPQAERRPPAWRAWAPAPPAWRASGLGRFGFRGFGSRRLRLRRFRNADFRLGRRRDRLLRRRERSGELFEVEFRRQGGLGRRFGLYGLRLRRLCFDGTGLGGFERGRRRGGDGSRRRRLRLGGLRRGGHGLRRLGLNRFRRPDVERFRFRRLGGGGRDLGGSFRGRGFGRLRLGTTAAREKVREARPASRRGFRRLGGGRRNRLGLGRRDGLGGERTARLDRGRRLAAGPGGRALAVARGARLAAHDRRLDQDVVRAADHDEMFDIVATHDDELAIRADVVRVDDAEPLLAAAGGAGADAIAAQGAVDDHHERQAEHDQDGGQQVARPRLVGQITW